MKDLVKKAESFVTFSMPLQAEFISIQFASIHNQYQREFSKWSTASTRQKLIATYWLSHVLEHFLLLFVLSGLTIFVTHRPAISYFLPGALLASVLVMPVLFLFHYWPSYAFDFLPKLEMAKESFENVQHDKIEKCRQAQLSNFALTLVFYVIDKTSEINTLQCNKQSAALLMRLYGVDNGSIKKNLELIFGKKRQLPPRKYTEIQNRFEEASAFFEDIQYQPGITILKDLKSKFHH